MAKIMIEIPLTKYLKLQSDYLGGPDGIYLTKVDKGKVYLSEDKPWIDENDISNYDFDNPPICIPKDFSKHIDIKRGESKLISQVIKEIKEKEKQ